MQPLDVVRNGLFHHQDDLNIVLFSHGNVGYHSTQLTYLSANAFCIEIIRSDHFISLNVSRCSIGYNIGVPYQDAGLQYGVPYSAEL